MSHDRPVCSCWFVGLTSRPFSCNLSSKGSLYDAPTTSKASRLVSMITRTLLVKVRGPAGGAVVMPLSGRSPKSAAPLLHGAIDLNRMGLDR